MERQYWLALAVLALLPLAALWGWQVVTDPGFRAGDSPSAASLHVSEAEAGVAPAAVVCEMLDDETGDARSVADAKAYADHHGLAYVEGSDLVAAFA